VLSLITTPKPVGPGLSLEAPSKFNFQNLGEGQLHLEGLRATGVGGVEKEREPWTLSSAGKRRWGILVVHWECLLGSRIEFE
jgi:hypothetical protein